MSLKNYLKNPSKYKVTSTPETVTLTKQKLEIDESGETPIIIAKDGETSQYTVQEIENEIMSLQEIISYLKRFRKLFL